MQRPGDECSKRGVDEGERPLSPLIEHMDEITRAMQREVRRALLIHKRLGNPIVVWEEGRGVVWIAPEDIDVDDSEFEGEPLIPVW